MWLFGPLITKKMGMGVTITTYTIKKKGKEKHSKAKFNFRKDYWIDDDIQISRNDQLNGLSDRQVVIPLIEAHNKFF